MQKRTFTRAAGVSPPWVEFALATAIGFCRLIAFRTTQSLPAPRLAHASRSWCTTCVRRAKATFTMHKRRCTGAAGVSPPWVSNPGAITKVYHGGLTPTAPGRHDVCSASKSDIYDAQTNVHRSGGRQPAVGRIRACNRDPLLRTDYVSPRTVASRTTAGSRQPLSVRDVCSASKSDICDGRTNVHKSGGRQPAVGV
jgi:hypothetical protein